MATNVAQHEPQDASQAPIQKPRTNAFFFGSAAQPLFGLYGPPQAEQDHDHGVLLCAPVGHEYMRSAWCLRLLGDQLIQSGFHVMRFDYSCLGDSWGTFEQASARQWIADIQSAVTELQDNAGVRNISLVGLRIGAALAWAAAQEVAVQNLILWDPVLEGREYVGQLRTMQTALRQTWRHAPTVTPGAAHEDLLGYRYTSALVDELRALKLDQDALPQAERVSLLLPSEAPRCEPLRAWIEENGKLGPARVVADAGDWTAVEDDLYAEPLLMPNMRRALVDLMGELAR